MKCVCVCACVCVCVCVYVCVCVFVCVWVCVCVKCVYSVRDKKEGIVKRCFRFELRCTYNRCCRCYVLRHATIMFNLSVSFHFNAETSRDRKCLRKRRGSLEVNFINILRAAFSSNSNYLQAQIVRREKLQKTPLYKITAPKLLMKLTPGVSFTNFFMSNFWTNIVFQKITCTNCK